MVMDRDRENALRVFLPDDVIVQYSLDITGSWNAVARFHELGFRFLTNDIHAQLNAFIADEYRWPGYKFTHLMLALAAEGAVKRILRITAGGLVGHVQPVIFR